MSNWPHLPKLVAGFFVICLSNFLLYFILYVYIFVKENHFSWVMIWLACLPVVNGGWLPHQTLWFKGTPLFPNGERVGLITCSVLPQIFTLGKKKSWLITFLYFLGVYDVWAHHSCYSYSHDVMCHNSQTAFNGKL